MPVYRKIDGVWTPTQRPYVRRSGVWMPATAVWVKQAGVWNMAYEHDVTPSAPPELSLQIMANRYIRVGARVPGGVDPDLKRIRVLVSRTAMPTTQFGAGYIKDEDNDWKGEAWSDWYYNGANGVADHGAATSTWNYKQYPVNPTSDTNLPGNQWYYFAAWTQDMNGNWSVGTYSQIFMPKEGNTAPKVLTKEANFQANEAGSGGVNGADFDSGRLLVQDSPQSTGYWFHGTQIINAIGSQGTPTIKSAKIRITRNNDAGQASANVRLFWHVKGQSSALPLNDDYRHDITKVGTLNKGETKWFDIPASFYSHFNTEIQGFGLASGPQASDYIVASGLAGDLRCGEVNVVWEEAL